MALRHLAGQPSETEQKKGVGQVVVHQGREGGQRPWRQWWGADMGFFVAVKGASGRRQRSPGWRARDGCGQELHGLGLAHGRNPVRSDDGCKVNRQWGRGAPARWRTAAKQGHIGALRWGARGPLRSWEAAELMHGRRSHEGGRGTRRRPGINNGTDKRRRMRRCSRAGGREERGPEEAQLGGRSRRRAGSPDGGEGLAGGGSLRGGTHGGEAA